MPAGTWNLGRLRKRIDYVGLKDLGAGIQDTSATSDRYFNVVEFPTTLTGGKNLFKLKTSANTLVKDSKIHIEVLDSNGNPIYYEPINYIEADGTRVVSIYIYPDTPYGSATVYLAGRARINEDGRSLRYSRDVNDKDYLNYPNVIWSRTVTVAPERLNSTEIIFTKKPILTLTEVVQPYLQPVNLTNVATQSMGIGTCTIKPKPTSISTVTNTISIGPGMTAATAIQGAATRNSPPSYYGAQIAPAPAALELAATSGHSVNVSPALGPVSATTTAIITAIDESVFETSVPFFTTDMSQGDVITVVNPNIEVPHLGAHLIAPGVLRPASQENDGAIPSSALAAATYALSGSYHFVISNIITTKKANIVLLPSPAGFKNVSDGNTGGKWQVELNRIGGSLRTQLIDEVVATADYTCSYTLPYVLQMTEQSQSFAEIKIADIEPATGDVYKLKTFYKAGGAFGDFTDAGETVLEQLEVLEDTGSFESQAIDGAQYNRTGFFSSLDDYNKYWTSSQGQIAPTIGITESFEPDDLMSGIRLTPASNFGTNDFSYIKLKDQYRPNLTKDTQYLLTINSFADTSVTSTDTNVTSLAQVDIYISGSQGKIQPDDLTQNAYVKSPFATYQNSLQGNFADNGPFGVRIGSIQLNGNESITPAVFRFNSLQEKQCDLILVVRNGRFNIGNISLKTFNESKFTPNFTRINTRIPTQFLKTPLTFKILFYDYLNNQAETEALIYPVTFTGENLVIGGNNNLLSGSVFIGNSVGSGIELAGVNSGYIRSIGYEGFKSASRTDQPGGFMLYTGSVLPNAPDNYVGSGLEIVEDSGSYFRFSTGTDAGIDIRTPKFFFGDETTSISGSNGNIKISGSNVEVATSTFFLGDKNTSISGSNGNIKISGSNLDLRSDTFFLGGASNFVSGANGNIEISSSDFHLNAQGQVVMQGTITADAGGSIGGFTIDANSLSATNFTLDASGKRITLGTGNSIFIADGDTGMWLGDADQADAPFNVNLAGALTASSGLVGGFNISATQINDAGNNLILKNSGDITGSQVLFTGGRIGGWGITANYLANVNADGGIKLDASNKVLTFRTGSNSDTEVTFLGNLGSNKYGIKQLDTDDLSKTIFKLGEDGNEIAGWTITDDQLSGGVMVIRKEGIIESSNFASNVAGSGFRLSAQDGGFLEVENARIRGTLSTAVFEKEAVNAVGGQLYIANSSTLTGSAVAPGGVHTATTVTMSLENVSGFESGEILTAKKVSDTGFQTEYIYVNSASRFDKASDTNFAGYLYVTRGYSGSAAGVTSSLGDIASSAQSYSGSQVIVSTGRVGTGYIRLNANPSDPYTPYIDIVERTGSAIYDVSLKARLGDLSGLSSTRLHGKSPVSAGFGLYTDNAFLEGGIIARTGSIAGIEMQSGKLFTGDGIHADEDTGFYIDSASKFSLGDKLTWDGTNLVVRGQLQISNGTPVGNGMTWSGSWASGKTYQLSDGVEYLGSSYIAIGASAHVSSNTNKPPNAASWSLMAGSGSDGVIGTNGDNGADAKTLSIVTDSNVYAFDNAADTSATPASIKFIISAQNLSSATDTNSIVIKDAGGNTIANPALSSSINSGTGIVTGSITFAGTSAGQLSSDKDKLPLTITVTEDGLSDVTTIHKVQGGTDGTGGLDAKNIVVTPDSYFFVKAQDGTYTPSSITISGSGQNLTATGSWSEVGSGTLTSEQKSGNTNSIKVTSANFSDGMQVVFTTHGDDGSIADSITLKELDEGSGNITAILSNEAHVLSATLNGTVSVTAGSGTTIQCFEGATALTYKTSSPGNGEFTVAIGQTANITEGTLSGNNTTTATVSDHTNIATGTDQYIITYTITGKTANGTDFTSFTKTQSLSKSKTGATGAEGTPAKGVIVNGTTLIFTKDIAGVITPTSASFTASTNNTTDDGAWSTIGGTLSNIDNAIGGAGDPPTCIVTKDNFADGMQITYTLANDDSGFADSATLKLLDAGSGNVQSVLSNQSHVYQANAAATVSDFSGGNTTLQVYEGATLLTYDDNSSITNGKYSASIDVTSIVAGAISGDGTTTFSLADPTAMSDLIGNIKIEVTGKTQNGTSFVLPVTQSFAKSVAGTTAKTIIVTPDSYIFTKAIDGTITPSSITISGSGQNLTGNGTWTEIGTGTLTDPQISGNDNSIKVTSANFVDGMQVVFTAHNDDNNITDSVTLKLLDAGSGNIQSIVSNANHTFQANHTGSIISFDGDTSIYTFEGTTKIPFTATLASSSLLLSSSIYTNVAKPLNWRAAPSGTMGGSTGTDYHDNMSINGTGHENAISGGIGPFGKQELLWECWPDQVRDADGGWNSSQQNIDTGSGYMFVVYAKRHFHEDSGSFYWGWRNRSVNNDIIDYASSNGTVAASGNPYFMSGDKQPELDRWYMHIGIVEPSASAGQTGGHHVLGGTYDLVTNTKISDASSFRFTSASAGLSHRCYHYYNTLTGSDGGSTPLAHSTKVQTMALPAVYKMDGTEPSLDMLYAGHRVDNDTELGKRVDIRTSGLNINSANLNVHITGSSQNGIAFVEQVNTISYNKTLAGAEPITVVQTNEAFTLVGDESGFPVNHLGSGTTISVFEGASQLQGIDDGDSLSSGQFKAVRSGDNISPGADSVNGKDVVIADHTSANETSGSVTYTITGMTVGGTNFTRTKFQSFTVSTRASSAKSLSIVTDSNVYAFDNAADTSATPTGIKFIISAQNLSSATDTNSIVIKDANNNIISNPSISSSITNGTGVITGSITFAGTLGSNKTKLPVTITVAEDGLSDVTTLHKVQGGTSGDPGLNAKTIVVTPDSYFFVKAQDGTYTPTEITISGSGQNLTQNASWSEIGSGTLTSPVNNTNSNSVKVTSGNFSDGMQVVLTTHGDDGPITDSITLKELDEGAGNVTAILSNEAHVLPADLNGAVTSHAGSGTTIKLFEGATALTYKTSSPGNGEFTVAIADTGNITEGSLSGNNTTTATVTDHAGSASGTDQYIITYTISGKTANGTAFTSFTKTQSLSKSKTGASGANAKTIIVTPDSYFFVKDIAGNYTPTSITISGSGQNLTQNGTWSEIGTGTLTSEQKSVNSNSVKVTSANFVDGMQIVFTAHGDDNNVTDSITLKELDAGSGNIVVSQTNPSHTFAANYTGSISDFSGGGTSLEVFEGATKLKYTPFNITSGSSTTGNAGGGWYSASISTQDITPTMLVNSASIFDRYHMIQGSSGAYGRYVFSTEAFDASDTSNSLSPQIQSDFSTAVNFKVHTKNADQITSNLWPNVVVGDQLIYWVSSSRWYEYEVNGIATNPSNNRFHFGLTFVQENATVGEPNIPKGSDPATFGHDVYFLRNPTKISLGAPTAMPSASAEIHFTITGSTLNGTAFEQFVTQSFAKSIAGSEPITVVQTNPSHTFVGDLTGTPTSHVGSGTTISVFEGASQLQGIDDAGTPANGQFEVARSGDNITPGADSVDGLDIAIADHTSANETSGSVTYTIGGVSSAGIAFTRVLKQPFSVTTQASNAKTVIVTPDSYFFVKAQDGTYTPSSITISGSGQNLTGNGAWTEIGSGTLSNAVVLGNNNSVKVTSGDFVDGMQVVFTSHANDGPITDSVTLKELDAGSGNVTAILSNEAHIYPASQNGTVSSTAGSGTEIRLFEGATALTYKTSSPGNGEFTVAIADTANITEGSLSGDNTTTATVSDHTSVSAGTDTYTITYTLTGKTQNGTSFTSFTKVQSLTKSKQGPTGAGGADGRVVNLTMAAQAFSYNTNGATPAPANSVVTATAANTTGTVKYQFLVNGSSVQAMGTTNTYTYTPQADVDNMPDTIEVRLSDDGVDGTIKAVDQITAIGLEAASDAVSIQLTNEAHTLPTTSTANPDGSTGVTYTNSGTDIKVWRGTTQMDADHAGGQGNDTFRVTTSATNISVGTASGTGYTRTFADHNSMTANTATITYTIVVKDNAGVETTFTRTQSFAKSIQGSDGSPGVTGATGPTFDFLTGSLATVDTTGGLDAGLILTGGVFGFHKDIAAGDGTNAQLSDFSSYLDDSGNFYLGKSDAVTNAYFAWDNSDGDESLLISGSEANIQVDKFYLGGKSQFISGSGGNIEISSSKFHLAANGDVSIDGTVEIGGVGPGNIVYYDDFSTYADIGALTGSGDAPKTDGSGVGYFKFVDNGEVSLDSSAETFNNNGVLFTAGNNTGNDRIWYSANTLIPINEHSLYEFEIRLRKPLGAGGTDGQYFGATVFDADGTTKRNVNDANDYSSQHYFVLANSSIGTTFEVHKGYIKGFGSAVGTTSTTKTSPTVFEDGAEGGYFAPLIIANHTSQAGKVEIDYIKVTEHAMGGLGTRISGDSITSGKILSNNHSGNSDGSALATAGMAIDLNGGAIAAKNFRITSGGDAFFNGAITITSFSDPTDAAGISANATTAANATATAQTQANTATTNAATAQTTANTGVTNAATAQTQANTATTNAATAQTQANTATTNAATAQTTANTAETNAQTGISNAATAATAASNAATAASNAATAASNASTAASNAQSAADNLKLSTLAVDSPTGTGLFLSGTNLGYYANSDWQTYLDNSGNFYLGGDSEGSLMWNASNNVLAIRGDITITNPEQFREIMPNPNLSAQAYNDGTVTHPYHVQYLYDDLDTSGGANADGCYTFHTQYNSDNDYSDAATAIQSNFSAALGLQIRDEDAGGNDHKTYYDSLIVGDYITFYISATRWYTYEIAAIASGAASCANFSINLVNENISGGESTISTSSGTNVYFRFQKAVDGGWSPLGIRNGYNNAGSSNSTDGEKQSRVKLVENEGIKVLELSSGANEAATEIGAVWPAFAVDTNTTYTIEVTVKADDADGNGFYIRMQEHNALMDAGNTSVCHQSGETNSPGVQTASNPTTTGGVQIGAAAKDINGQPLDAENGPIETYWVTYYMTYTPHATTKVASLSILNWLGMAPTHTKLFCKYASIRDNKLDTTSISGDTISTGKMQSSNFSGTAGSEYNLNDGTIKLGGSTNPSFEVTAAGIATANALRNKCITITHDNMHRFIRTTQVTAPNPDVYESTIFLDGSLDANGAIQSAGDYTEFICSHVKIDINMIPAGSGSNTNGDSVALGAIWKVKPPAMIGSDDKVEFTIEVSTGRQVYFTDGYNSDGSGQQYNNIYAAAAEATYRD